MEIKNGLYAVYQGKEYRAAKAEGGVKLIAEGPDAPEGFQKTPYHNFTKTVKREEITKLELVKSYAAYGGGRFEIADKTAQGIVIATSDEAVARRLGMRRMDRMDYRMEIPWREAEAITESRREIE